VEYLIPKSTYNLDGLSVQELQRLVARPEQIRTACRKHEEGLILFRERTCQLPESSWIHSAVMVPGGRWLITGHTLGRLKVWDLNASKDANGCFASVHSAQLFGCSGHIGVLLIQQSQDCDGVVVLTESLEQDEPYIINYFPYPTVADKATQERIQSRSGAVHVEWARASSNSCL
jgi:hypothetical protein